METNRNTPVATRSHQQAYFSIETASSSDVSKNLIKLNGQVIPFDVLYAEKLKLEEDYKDVVLFSRSTYNINMTDGKEPAIMYLVVH